MKRKTVPIGMLGLCLAAFAAMESLAQNQGSAMTGMQKLAQIKALHEQTEPQVKAILSQQQFDQLQEIRRQESRR